MYYLDTPTQQVAAFDYDIETGFIRNRRVAVEIPEEIGCPDGMTIDSEGMIWVAHLGRMASDKMESEYRETIGRCSGPCFAGHFVHIWWSTSGQAVHHHGSSRTR